MGGRPAIRASCFICSTLRSRSQRAIFTTHNLIVTQVSNDLRVQLHRFYNEIGRPSILSASVLPGNPPPRPTPNFATGTAVIPFGNIPAQVSIRSRAGIFVVLSDIIPDR
jgi:hypothetical protein